MGQPKRSLSWREASIQIGKLNDLDCSFPTCRPGEPAHGSSDHPALGVTKHPVMENRFPRKPDMKLQNALFRARDTVMPIEKPHPLELAAQMRVQVDNGVAEPGKGPRKLLGPLHAGVPIVHGKEDNGAITTFERI